VAPLLSVVSDEIAPDIDTAIRFACAHGLAHLDLRSIGGRNLIDFENAELDALRRTLAAAGIRVACFASPLLKWLPPEIAAPPQPHDAFGFSAGAVDEPRRFRRAFEICARLGISRLRIFSYLAYDGFHLERLRRPLAALIELAERHDCELLLENEPVCNIRGIADMAAFRAEFAHDRLRLLFDLGNLASMGETPSPAQITALAPGIGYIHIKDLAPGGGFVPLGQGTVDHRGAFAAIAAAAPLDAIPVALETHMPRQGWGACAAALAALRPMLAELG